MVPARQSEWVFRDQVGHQLRVVWSRSGKSAGVGIILPLPWRFAQLGLYPDQLAVLADFLGGEPRAVRAADGAGDDTLELEDRDHSGARLQLAWNRQGNRMTVSMIPATPWEGDPPVVTLGADQVAKLAGFVGAGPP